MTLFWFEFMLKEDELSTEANNVKQIGEILCINSFIYANQIYRAKRIMNVRIFTLSLVVHLSTTYSYMCQDNKDKRRSRHCGGYAWVYQRCNSVNENNAKTAKMTEEAK